MSMVAAASSAVLLDGAEEWRLLEKFPRPNSTSLALLPGGTSDENPAADGKKVLRVNAFWLA